MRLFKRKPVTRKQLANRKAWVEALNSGKYQQGIGFLKTSLDGRYEYCCLGVAAEAVLGLEAKRTNPQDEFATACYGFEFKGHGTDHSLMPESVFRDTFGFTTQQNVFSEANDNGGYNFHSIAAKIPLSRDETRVDLP